MEQREIRRERTPYLSRLLLFVWRPAEALLVATIRITVVSGCPILVELGGHHAPSTAYERGPPLLGA